MHRIIISTLLACAVAAHASAAPCTSSGDPAARELTFNLKDPKVLAGLSVSFKFGLLPPEFPENDISVHRDPCSRGPFPFTNGMTMDLQGENSDAPPRWAISPIPGPTVYVAIMPRPEPARLAAQAAARRGSADFKPGDMMYAVVLTLGDTKRHVFHFFDHIPDDGRLKALFRKIVISQEKELVVYDTKTGALR